MTSAQAGDLEIEVVAVGDGIIAETGMRVSVHYRGELLDGTVFDDSSRRGQPISFVLGQGQVIPGWEQGIAGMKVGEKRILTIPPELGYGSAGAGNVIPPDATLIFHVELMDAAEPVTLVEATPEDLKSARDSGVTIIDIRREDEWASTGVIEGAHLITAFTEQGQLHPEFQEKFSALVPNREVPVLLYCRTGNRSSVLGQALINELEFINVTHLTDGMIGWLEDGHPVTDYK
ncbi:FKBP-type peptidyl-prolyl cis-trans isomerase [Alphaproteobacteria bacterium LSUCC0684]